MNSISEEKKQKNLRAEKVLRIATEAEVSVDTVRKVFKVYDFIKEKVDAIKALFSIETYKP